MTEPNELLKTSVDALPDSPVALLPSPFVTIVESKAEVSILGPHQRIWVLSEATKLAFCLPNLLKIIFGHPKYFVNKQFTPNELPLLEPFMYNDWQELLDEARESVSLLPDEQQFLKEWPNIITGRIPREDSVQRQNERLALRYAGQSPMQILQEIRLATQLAADIREQDYTPLGEYTDQSHYIRECRRHTGQTPRYWRNLSAAFYTFDGHLVMMKK